MRAILKQGAWLLVAQVLGKALGFVYAIFLAGALGVSEFGLYSAALAFFSLLSAASDFGFNRFLIREVARDRQRTAELLSNIVFFRLSLTAVLFAVFALLLYILDPDKMRVNLTLLAALAILPQSVAMTLDGVFVAHRKLQWSALGWLLAGTLHALAGFLLVVSGLGSKGAVLALSVGQLGYALFLIWLLRKQNLSLLAGVTFKVIKTILLGSLPYGLLGILGLLYFRIDTLLLSYLRGSFETGLYGISYRFLDSIVFIHSAISMALFPVLARLHESDLSGVKRLYWQSLKLMLVIGVLVTAGYVLVLPELVRIYLPKYLPSIPVIRILALSIPFMFMHVPAVQVLFSTDKYLKSVIVLSFVTLLLNVSLNWLFIPLYGLYAAAWITSFSELLSFVIFFVLLNVKILSK